MSDKVSILTPEGRMVQGDLYNPQTKDMDGRPLVDKNNNPRSQYFVAIAVPKDHQHWQNFWSTVYSIGAAGFPGGEYQQAGFAWKIVDGDRHPEKEGFAGCWVIRLTTGFPQGVFKYNQQTQKYEELTEQNAVKRGDYIRSYITVAPNGDKRKPGMYLNLGMVELIGYGEAIKGGPDPNEAFQAPPQMPAGASPHPVAPSSTPPAPGGPAPPPGGPPAPGGQAPPPGGQAPPPGGQAPAPGGPPAPAYDFANPGAPPAPGGGYSESKPAMTEKAGGIPYEAFIKQGWTGEQLVQNGYMISDEVPF